MKLVFQKILNEHITPAITVVPSTQPFTVMKKFKAFVIKHKIHLVSWAIFVPVESFLIGLATGIFGDLESYFVHYTVNIAVFYFCSLWLFPNVFSKKLDWIWKLPLFGTMLFGVYLAISYYLDNHVLKDTTWYGLHEISISRKYIFGQLWRLLFFMGSAAFYFLFRRFEAEIKIRKQTEDEHHQSQLSERDLALQLENAKNAYLKAQINPHLLFNTLSFVYQDIFETSPRTAEAVMELSEVMRYSINCEFKGPTVELGEEIKQVERLIQLQAKRFDGEIFIDFQYPPEIKNIKFIPLILLTLTENIFKHGVYQDPNYPVLLSIAVEKSSIHITSRNWPNRQNNSHSMNKGLNNIKSRLHYTYGEQATFKHEHDQGYFTINITAPVHSEINQNIFFNETH